MHAYGTKDVERILGLPRGAAAALARRGYLNPKRVAGREYQFSFQDLIILRAARSLAAARIPNRSIHRSLVKLRKLLPPTLPLSGLSISAVGDRIIVREGAAYWETRSGQYVLQFDVIAEGPALKILAPARAPREETVDRESLFELALSLEHDAALAIEAYRRCLESDPHCVEARINCGRLLHELGSLEAAEQIYRGSAVVRDATLLFNLGVLLEDLGRPEEAKSAYHTALDVDGMFADAHYNLAILSERRGRCSEALRHLSQYRRLTRER